MGTRAFVEFPTYVVSNGYNKEEDKIYLEFGEQIGTVYVYVQYDGDQLPVDLRETLLALTTRKAWEVKMTRSQKLAQLNPEYVAAQLVRTIVDDGRGESVSVYACQPQEGFHLVCDLKTQTISYMGQSDRDDTILHWMQEDTAKVFTLRN